MSSFILNIQIQPNFKLGEFITGTYNTMPIQCSQMALESLTPSICENIVKVATLAQEIRDHFNDSLIITCCYRPIEWELKQGRSGKSQHVEALAMDCYLTHIHLLELYAWFNKQYPNKYGRAINPAQNFCHFDLRPNYATWNY